MPLLPFVHSKDRYKIGGHWRTRITMKLVHVRTTIRGVTGPHRSPGRRLIRRNGRSYHTTKGYRD